jgi:hypothetical protein
MFHPKSRIHPMPAVAVALALFLALAADPVPAQVNIQVIPFDTTTLSTKQVLLGETQGQPTTDPCIEFGVSLQYDEAATASTREAVKGVLTSAFSAKPAAGATK